MTRSILGAALLLLLGAGSVGAQESGMCAPSPMSELTVWRGTVLSVSEVPALLPQAACESVRQASSPGEIAVSDAGLVLGEALGIPDLTEIEALVLASPEIRGLLATPRAAGSVPEIVERSTSVSTGGRGLRDVIHDPALGDTPASMIHLIVREASPGRLQVDVQPLGGPEVTLRWTRSIQDPTWSPLAEASAS